MEKLKRLFSFHGEISGYDYLWWGLLLFAIKYPLDWLVATHVVGMKWHPLVYASVQMNPLFARGADSHRWLPMIAIALPFLWIGLALTVQRIRALRRPPAWALLFFVPFLNLAFFMFLVLMKPRELPAESQVHGPWDRWVPESQLACIVLAQALSLFAAGAGYLISARLHMPYGSTVFFAIPFLCGYFTRLLIGYRHDVSLRGALGWAAASQLVCAGVLVSFAFEGIFCVTIALPVVIPIAMLGAGLAHATADITFPHLKGKVLGVAWVVPLALAVDALVCYRDPGERAVVTVINVRAAPEACWKNLVEFPAIQRPDAAQDIFDKFMIPRLVGATIEGRGVGAIRRCRFHTGEFVEPIEVWKPGEELTFGVTSQPARLDGCINVRRGQFKLTREADGSTTIVGTTWYEVSLFPPVYWDRWMQKFLHATHTRALEHIRDLTEGRVY